MTKSDLRVQKRKTSLNLLSNNYSYSQVQSKLKEKYGEGLSPRDLQLIRSSVFPSPSKQDLIDAFQSCFLTLALSEVKKAHPEVKKVIKKFADLMITLEKQQMLNDTLPEFRDSEIILIGLNTLEKSKKLWLT